MAISRTQIPAFHQSGMPLAFKQDRGTSGNPGPKPIFHALGSRVIPGCSQQQGVIDHVRLQPPLCRIASSTRGRQASLDPISTSPTRGFAAIGEPGMAVCLLPGTEVAFERDVECDAAFPFMRNRSLKQKVARFRQVNPEQPTRHHDALEFPDGQIALVTDLGEGQRATVLQSLPAPERAAPTANSASLQEMKNTDFTEQWTAMQKTFLPTSAISAPLRDNAQRF